MCIEQTEFRTIDPNTGVFPVSNLWPGGNNFTHLYIKTLDAELVLLNIPQVNKVR